MRLHAIAAFAVSVQLAAVGMAFAADQSTGMMHGSGMTKARCSPGDPNVMVNKTNKTFVMDTKAKAPMKGSASGTAADTGMAPATNKSMVSMCKSEAMSMGAKMSTGSSSKKM